MELNSGIVHPISVNGSRGNKDLKEERTSKMFNANRDGLDRHSDDVGSNAGSTCRSLLLVRMRHDEQHD